MKIKTSELTGPALNWAVAKCEGYTIEIRPAGPCGRPLYVLASPTDHTPWVWLPSESWHHGGPIIERENIWLTHHVAAKMHGAHKGDDAWFQKGPTPLIAAMRCFVASKLGDKVDIPDELIKTA